MVFKIIKKKIYIYFNIRRIKNKRMGNRLFKEPKHNSQIYNTNKTVTPVLKRQTNTPPMNTPPMNTPPMNTPPMINNTPPLPPNNIQNEFITNNTMVLVNRKQQQKQQRLIDRLEKLRYKRLAEGMYGIVYKSVDPFRGKEIIRKTIKSNVRLNNNDAQEEIAALTNQAEIYRQLSKKQDLKGTFPEFFAFENNKLYIEYLSDHRTMRNVLFDPQLDYHIKYEIVKNILKVLKAYHDHGIFQYDFYNGENILINNNNQNDVKIIDFGLSFTEDYLKNKSWSQVDKKILTVNPEYVSESFATLYDSLKNKMLNEMGTIITNKREFRNLLSSIKFYDGIIVTSQDLDQLMNFIKEFELRQLYMIYFIPIFLNRYDAIMERIVASFKFNYDLEDSLKKLKKLYQKLS